MAAWEFWQTNAFSVRIPWVRLGAVGFTLTHALCMHKHYISFILVMETNLFSLYATHYHSLPCGCNWRASCNKCMTWFWRISIFLENLHTVSMKWSEKFRVYIQCCNSLGSQNNTRLTHAFYLYDIQVV